LVSKEETSMEFYHKQHQYYCGIDLHEKTMYVCIVDQSGKIRYHRNIKTSREEFLAAVAPYREDVVVGIESTYAWYWLADLCEDEGISFILGHALYLKAVHGGKTKNDRADSKTLAFILRGGNFPTAYVYPRNMRATRDLLRRRMYLSKKRAAVLTHIRNTNSQYNLGSFEKRLKYKSNRKGVAERFEDRSVRKSIQVDLSLLDFYDEILRDLELYILKTARVDDSISLYILQTIPGIGDILSLVMMYEIHHIKRFKTQQDFLSYCRLVKCPRESGGKKYPVKNSKIGNAYLKWAFSEAATLFLRGNPYIEKKHNRRISKYGKAKALSILARDLGTAVYFMLKRKEMFDMNKFLGAGDASYTPNWTGQRETLDKATGMNCIKECESVAIRHIP
jgi:transposase